MRELIKINNQWDPKSWKNFPITQQPKWPNQKINKISNELSKFPALVPIHEIVSLKKQFKNVANNNAFILIAGDCAETFSDFKHDLIEKKLQIIFQMSLILGYELKKPIIKIARLAGQFAKPRSLKEETQNNITLPSYMGDAVNSIKFNKISRTPDPKRLLKAYNQSAGTLNLLRSLIEKDIYDIINNWGFKPTSKSISKNILNLKTIQNAINFSKTINSEGMYKHIFSKDFFTAHEALLLDYEQSLTRQDNKNKLWYDCSSHLVWLGYRTGNPNGAHVEFLSGIQNPIGIKVGIKTNTKDLIEIIRKLNPSNELGKIILILRYGKNDIEEFLPILIKQIQSKNLNVLWISDPMHGNTFTTKEGFKTRDFNDIIQELKSFIKILDHNNIAPSGVHFELTPENVTECISESYNIKQSNIHEKYETACDPRLNKYQSLDISFRITELLKG